ncbi:MAG: hypothetical protein WKG00_14260 [Polyangiaceae bacterium]
MRWRSAWLGVAAGFGLLASCWYEIPDPAAEDVTAATTGASSGAASSAGSGAGSGAGGSGQGGAGDGGQAGGANTAGAGGGELIPVGGAFTACQENGYSGYCVGMQLLVYDDSSPACRNVPTDACILNRCISEGKTCGLDPDSRCEEHLCSDGYHADNYEICGTTDILAEGECIDGVAIVPTSESRCAFKDCTKVGGTCQGPPTVPTTDCYQYADAVSP